MIAVAVVPHRTMSHGHPGEPISPQMLAAAARVGAYSARRMALAVAAFEADAACVADAAAAKAVETTTAAAT